MEKYYGGWGDSGNDIPTGGNFMRQQYTKEYNILKSKERVFFWKALISLLLFVCSAIFLYLIPEFSDSRLALISSMAVLSILIYSLYYMALIMLYKSTRKDIMTKILKCH